MKTNGIRPLFVILMLMAGGSLTKALGQTSAAKPQVARPDAVRHTVQITPQERSQIESAVIAHPEVQNIVGLEKPRVIVSEAHADKAEAEAFLSGATKTPPSHIVRVVIFNPKTNRAVHTTMSLEQRRVLEVREIKPNEVPLSRQDADEALVLAKTNAEVRRAAGSRVDQFVILESGNDARVPLAAQVLPTASSDPSDPCSADRCLELIFRNENGYLPFRAGVNLTKHTVTFIGNEQHEGGR